MAWRHRAVIGALGGYPRIIYSTFISEATQERMHASESASRSEDLQEGCSAARPVRTSVLSLLFWEDLCPVLFVFTVEVKISFKFSQSLECHPAKKQPTGRTLVLGAFGHPFPYVVADNARS